MTQPTAAAMERARLRGIVARGYCHKANSSKVLDGDLLEAIVDELLAAPDPRLEEIKGLLEKANLQTLTLETVPTSIGYCHKIGPLPGNQRHETSACIYHDNYRPDQPDEALLATAKLFVACVNFCKERVGK